MEVSSPVTLLEYQPSVIYDGDEEVAEIVIPENVRSTMERSYWTSKRLITKGHWTLRNQNKESLHVSYYGQFFWKEGQKGYYIVQDADRNTFKEFCEQVFNDYIFPHRENRNANN